MQSIADLYGYSLLATAAYVRMGDQPESLQRDGATFAAQAAIQSRGRLPFSIAQYLFDPPQGSGVTPWTIAHYQGGDVPGSADASGFAAMLFRKGRENVLLIRGGSPAVVGCGDYSVLM